MPKAGGASRLKGILGGSEKKSNESKAKSVKSKDELNLNSKLFGEISDEKSQKSSENDNTPIRNSVRKAYDSVKIKDKQTVADYILIDVIGKGGYGTVYKGLHKFKGNFVAVKKILLSKSTSEDSVGSLMLEIKLLQRLKHPNIVKYIDHIHSKRSIYISMEFMEIGSLEHMVRKHGVFPEELVSVYMKQILAGLNYLHGEGVVHRDIKAANILVSSDGSVKLADFGVATVLSDKRAGSDEDEFGGTPHWMAPEVITMQSATTACDIWSMGCTVIELLTGRPPYWELPLAAALYSIVNEDRPPLPEGISSSLKDFLTRCLHKDQNLRVDAITLLSHAWTRQDLKSSVGGELGEVQQQLSEYNEQLEEIGRKVERVSSNSGSSSFPFGNSPNNNLRNSPKFSAKLKVTSPQNSRSLSPRTNLMLGKSISKFGEEEDESFEDIGMESVGLSGKISKLKLNQEREWDDEIEVAFEDASEPSLMNEKFKDQLVKDISNFIQQIENDKDPQKIIKACEQLKQVFKTNPNEKSNLITKNGITPLLEHLSTENQDNNVVFSVLKLLNQTIDDPSVQDAVCLLGGIPLITSFSSEKHQVYIRIEVSRFVRAICSASSLTLHMFVSCRGFPILVSLLEGDYRECKEMIHNSLDSMLKIFRLQTPTPKNAFCHLFCKVGIIERIANILKGMKNHSASLHVQGDSQDLLFKLSEVLVTFSLADSQLVKKDISQQSILLAVADTLMSIKPLKKQLVRKGSSRTMNRFIVEAPLLDPKAIQSMDLTGTKGVKLREALLRFLKTLKNLSSDRDCRDQLEKSGMIEILVSYLDLDEEHIPKVQEIHNQALNALFNICQLNKKLQERTAVAGAISPLQKIINEKSPLRDLAVSILFTLLHSSHRSRQLMWDSNSLGVLVQLLEDPTYFVDSMEAISAWLSFEPIKMEATLMTPNHLNSLLKIFVDHVDSPTFAKVLQPFFNLISSSVVLNKLLGAPERGELVPKLLVIIGDTKDPFSKVRLLKILNSIFVNSDKKKELLENYKLFDQIKSVAEKDDRVVISNMTDLLLQNFTSIK
eukprot:TRINITY_DN1643_c1_g2_i1.p1 TRINITY_DN1643_c1_g2~~TRINITY_DN1643_c1_g2_i1.p1  ORF type:complete len:1059 (-),score=373.24 TRINITY_DN1643_c1_g2_i1:7-3183(-)